MLRADSTFLNGRGVALSAVINWGSTRRAATLVSDGEQHDRLRRAVAAPLRPRGLGEIQKPLEEAACQRVDALAGAGEFEAMRELASHLPTTVVAQMAGLHPNRQARMLEWSRAAFNVFGVLNARALRSIPAFGHFDRTMRRLRRADVRPGSWNERLFDLRDAGEIEAVELAGLVGDYIGPSLATTIMATGHLLSRLARHPEAWEQLRADPSLAAGAVAETLRIDSPVKMLTRCAAHDTEVAGHAIPAGARIAVVYAAANRDERRYADPDRFDIERDARDHLAFGHGAHACVGAALAQMEMEALLHALVERVARIRDRHAEDPDEQRPVGIRAPADDARSRRRLSGLAGVSGMPIRM